VAVGFFRHHRVAAGEEVDGGVAVLGPGGWQVASAMMTAPRRRAAECVEVLVTMVAPAARPLRT
jgi:hypothetical protein